jgi:translation initiation factor 3 subunit A
MENDKNEFLISIRGQRHEDYIKDMREYEQRLNVARQQRLVQLRREYVEKKKQNFRREKELAKQRKRDEEQQRIQAEIRRKEDERLAAQRAVDEERNKKLADQARKQRERDEEIERKLQAEKETAHQPAAASSTVTVRRTVHTGSGHTQDKDKTDNRPWRRNLREGDENQPSHTDSADNWRVRNEEQR